MRRAFTGEGTVTGSTDTFTAELVIYADGSFSCTADGFEEGGMILLNREEGAFRIFPDNPTDGVRGLSQVSSVPNGTLEETDGKLILSEFRARTSEGFGRDKVVFTEN